MAFCFLLPFPQRLHRLTKPRRIMAARRQVALVAPKTGRLSLSDRFALIQREAASKKQQRPAAVAAPKAAKAVTLGANRAGRAAAQQTKVQAKKQAKQDATRGKKGNAAPDTKKKAAAAGKKAAAAAAGTKKGKGVKGDKQGVKQQDKKKAAKKDTKKAEKPATEADLDMEMAEYLHKGERVTAW